MIETPINLDNYIIDAEAIKAAQKAYGRYRSLLYEYNTLHAKYKEKCKHKEESYEDFISLPSTSNLDLGTSIQSASRLSPQERLTEEFDFEETRLVRLGAKVSELETILLKAISLAVANASLSFRAKAKNAVKRNLMEGIPAENVRTLSKDATLKYRKLSLKYAAVILGYAEKKSPQRVLKLTSDERLNAIGLL